MTSAPLGGVGPLGRPGGGGGGGSTVIDAGGADNIVWIAAAAVVNTNEPDAVTEWPLGNANRRIPADLTGRSTIQPYAAGTVVAGPGSVLILKYSLDNGSNWLDFTGVASVDTTALLAGTSTTIGTARAIPAQAQTDVLLTWFSDGDATATDDPAVTTLGAVVV